MGDPDAETVKARVQQYWNDRAESYDGDSHHAVQDEAQRDAWLSVLQEWTGDGTETPPRRVLDVGCGTGVISLLLAEIGHDVTGVDLSTDMLERARAKAGERDLSVAFRAEDAESIADPENAYDLVTARHLIWTLPNPTAALREWQRVVRPGGRIVLIEGHWDFDEAFDGYQEIHDELPLYDGRPPEELVTVLEEHGLERVEYEPLMESVLWGDEPEYEQYVVAGDVPE
ncbi:class I SAM-dependent methyltransferase [Halopiger aswanensis]|uniref:Ubiquinone/menaquinone biosynthesis C-methylase UbiE n=1 Tax=Halopiger aswanensis TaxID=148449 RepID=A0A3R7EH79_9EURY|nr:class I SAM-dependent methyltransferase [Halopiger aswanensis]RKD97614.1 ubiquinone/menaquinone biosynthesis C-methylase UbiE [Halopiger aswanensis]